MISCHNAPLPTTSKHPKTFEKNCDAAPKRLNLVADIPATKLGIPKEHVKEKIFGEFLFQLFQIAHALCFIKTALWSQN